MPLVREMAQSSMFTLGDIGSGRFFLRYHARRGLGLCFAGREFLDERRLQVWIGNGEGIGKAAYCTGRKWSVRIMHIELCCASALPERMMGHSSSGGLDAKIPLRWRMTMN